MWDNIFKTSFSITEHLSIIKVGIKDVGREGGVFKKRKKKEIMKNRRRIKNKNLKRNVSQEIVQT